MRQIRTLAALAFSIVVFAASRASAGIPHYVSLQGVLTDASEQPIDGARNMTFRIYDVSSGGSAIWSETQSVTIDQGRYSVLLGNVTPLDLPFNVDYWLGIEVQADGEMTPRYKVASSPYAYNAEAVSAIRASATPQADALLALDSSAKFPNSVLNTGPGNGLDADTVDTKHAADFADAVHAHDGADIATGVIDNARLNVGTGADQLVALDASAKLPAVDGSQLLNLPGGVSVPVGGVVPWLKSLPGCPALPSNFVECNGQTLSDTLSPFDGQVIPDLNGYNRFLRGSSTSGNTGGSETHNHQWLDRGGADGGVFEQRASTAGRNRTWTSDGTTIQDLSYGVDSWTTNSSHLPPYYEVVWVIRIK